MALSPDEQFPHALLPSDSESKRPAVVVTLRCGDLERVSEWQPAAPHLSATLERLLVLHDGCVLTSWLYRVPDKAERASCFVLFQSVGGKEISRCECAGTLLAADGPSGIALFGDQNDKMREHALADGKLIREHERFFGVRSIEDELAAFVPSKGALCITTMGRWEVEVLASGADRASVATFYALEGGTQASGVDGSMKAWHLSCIGGGVAAQTMLLVTSINLNGAISIHSLPDGRVLKRWGELCDNQFRPKPGKFSQPWSAVGDVFGNVWVTDKETRQLTVFR